MTMRPTMTTRTTAKRYSPDVIYRQAILRQWFNFKNKYGIYSLETKEQSRKVKKRNERR